MNMESGDTPLIFLAPAWRRWGTATSVKKNCVVIHSPHDEFVPCEDSVELCEASGIRLLAAGLDHRLNCEEGRRAIREALGVVTAI
jgi:hypothetical protein